MSLNISENAGRRIASDDFERQAGLEEDPFISGIDQRLSVQLRNFEIPLTAILPIIHLWTPISGLWAIIRKNGQNNTEIVTKGKKN